MSSHHLLLRTPPQHVQAYLLDLQRRPEWDWSLRGVRMQGPAQVGATGVFLKMVGADQSFSIITVENDRFILKEQTTAGAVLWEHQFKAEGEGTSLQISLTASGAGRLARGLERAAQQAAERLQQRLDRPTEHTSQHRFLLEGFPMVHRAMRSDVSRLERLIQRVQDGEGMDLEVVRAWFAFSWAIAEGHHKGEDAEIFPRVAARSPLFRAVWTQIEAEHQQIDAMVVQLNASIQALRDESTYPEQQLADLLAQIRDFRRLLEDHVQREEQAFEQAICADFAEDEQMKLQNVLRKAIPMRLIELVIPWMLEMATEAERKRFLGQLPLPARFLYWLLWQPHYHTLIAPFRSLPSV